MRAWCSSSGSERTGAVRDAMGLPVAEPAANLDSPVCSGDPYAEQQLGCQERQDVPSFVVNRLVGAKRLPRQRCK
jgi:hypothetical protein